MNQDTRMRAREVKALDEDWLTDRLRAATVCRLHTRLRINFDDRKTWGEFRKCARRKARNGKRFYIALPVSCRILALNLLNYDCSPICAEKNYPTIKRKTWMKTCRNIVFLFILVVYSEFHPRTSRINLHFKICETKMTRKGKLWKRFTWVRTFVA